jgi:poly-gamma-glutamate capsule biosynthesis protein CapA/YwtB (metallophosphatase superfamily)
MSLTLFLCGDVMVGRGIDQVLPHPCDPELYEPYVRDAREYIELAERAHGPIPRSIDPSYLWGDALPELAKRAPDARIINLETSITDNGKPWPGKGIHYRMHPRNIACLSAARVDCCVLANNHVLDFGYTGLEDTTDALCAAGIQGAGAGCDQKEAARPARIRVPGDRRVMA